MIAVLLINTLIPTLSVARTEGEETVFYKMANKESFSLNVDALYIQPQNLSEDSHELETLFNWGFTLAGKYHFNSGKSLYVQWEHFKDFNHDLVKPINDFESEGPVDMVYGYISGFDVLNIQLSQLMRFNSQFDFTLHGGFEYAKMEAFQEYRIVSATTSRLYQYQNRRQYAGFGGVLGLDIDYHMRQNWTVLINSNWEILSQNTRLFVNTIDRTSAPSSAYSHQGVIKGALLGAYVLTALEYQTQVLSEKLSFDMGWIAILYNDDNLSWSGGAFGLRWREHL